MTVILTLALAFFVAPSADPSDDAVKLATKLTTDGSALFDKKDAKALAETFTEDATVNMISRDKETGLAKIDTKRGRAEIQDQYLSLFKDAGPIHSKNHVEYAKKTGGDFLIISGVFEPDLGYSFNIAFSQIRIKQNDKWLVLSMDLILEEKK